MMINVLSFPFPLPGSCGGCPPCPSCWPSLCTTRCVASTCVATPEAGWSRRPTIKCYAREREESGLVGRSVGGGNDDQGRLWTDADYYYEDHVDNVWSIIISVLLNEERARASRGRTTKAVGLIKSVVVVLMVAERRGGASSSYNRKSV